MLLRFPDLRARRIARRYDAVCPSTPAVAEPYRAKSPRPSDRTFRQAVALLADARYQVARATDEALGRLAVPDRMLLELRYAGRMPWAHLGVVLGASPEEAHARCAVLVERVRREAEAALGAAARLLGTGAGAGTGAAPGAEERG